MKQETTGYYGIKKKENKLLSERMRTALLLLLVAFFLLVFEYYVTAVRAQEIFTSPDVGGDIIGAGASASAGETDDYVVQSREEAFGGTIDTIAEYWGLADVWAEWIAIGLGGIVGFAFGLSLIRNVKGYVGLALGIAGGGILWWSIWGIWDQATKGHVVGLILVGVAVFIAAGQEAAADLGIAAVIFIYFSIILDPIWGKTYLWDWLNGFNEPNPFLRDWFGATSWSDLFNIGE